MKQFIILFWLSLPSLIFAQITFPINDVADNRTGAFAFTNATIIPSAGTELKNATLLIRKGMIAA